MPKTKDFIRKETKDGQFSGRLYKENNIRLNLYCEINNLNKTIALNNIVKTFLDDKFMKLKEESNNAETK